MASLPSWTPLLIRKVISLDLYVDVAFLKPSVTLDHSLSARFSLPRTHFTDGETGSEKRRIGNGIQW